MSCSQPTDEGLEAPAPAPPPAAHCVRCSSPPGIVVRTTAYCWEHFSDHLAFSWKQGINGARQRSRAGCPEDVNTGKKRGTKRSKVMLAFSGGASSRAMMDLVERYNFVAPKDENPRFKPPPTFESLEVLYVDESGLPGFGPDRTEEIRNIVSSTSFAFRSVKLEAIFADATLSASYASPSLTASSSTSSATPLDQLRALLSPSRHSTTSLAALHSSLLHALMRREAVNAGCEVLLTGETATRVAIKTIAGMSEGRGFSMGEEVGSEWDLAEERLLVCRPLSSVLLKELVYYCRMRELRWLTMQRPETGVEAKKAGIEALTEEFVNGLEANFPSTVSTIIRTAQKLGMRSADARERHEAVPTCPLCGLPAQVGAEDWRKAITISSLENSRAAASNIVPSSPSSPTAASSSSIDLTPLLCYSCLLVMQGTQPPPRGEVSAETVVLPSYVGELARGREVIGVRTIGAEEVKETVSEYLIK